jgi:spore coat protein U-like protein
MVVAGEATGTVTVTANVVATCSVANSALAFGAYDPFSPTPKDVVAPLTFTCTNSTTAWIGLDHVGARAMTNPAGGANLTYEIYSDNFSTASKVWGNDQANGVAVIGTGGPAVVSMFGRIPAGQLGLSPGNFSQSILATINY